MKNYLKTFITPETRRQFTRVFVIGIFNTVLYFVLSNLFRSGLGWDTGWAVGVAFIIGTLISYLLNRRWSFELRGARPSETLGFVVVNSAALVVTELIVKGTELLTGELSVVQFNALNAVAALAIIAPKFAAYRDVVFRKALAQRP
ncbi:MAG TPA: GtrA family protein [Acidimicrobiia bacterium]|nr:GtrA family protein [Acidimicrobiia bacterium]